MSTERVNYCSCNIEKIKNVSDKGRGSMGERFKHNTRIYTPPNVDPDLTYLNEELIPLKEHTYREAYEQTIARAQEQGTMGTIRKDAVRGIEIELSFSYTPDDFDLQSWKEDNLNWLKNKFGEDNLKHVVLHMDEACGPHIHAYIVPMDKNGRLNCKYFIDGPRGMSKIQTEYYEEVGKKHGFHRGVKRSPVKHQEIAQFKHDTLKRAIVDEKELEPTLEEMTPEGNLKPEYAERVKKIAQAYSFQSLDRANREQQRLNEEFARLSNERIELIKQQEEYSKRKQALEDLAYDLVKKIEKEGEYEKVRDLLRTYEMLSNGLKNYPDKQYAKETADRVNKIAAWQHRQDKERREAIEQQVGLKSR